MNEVEASLVRAQALLAAGETQAAESLLIAALRTDISHLPSLATYLGLLAQLRRWDESVELARRAISIAPRMAFFSNHLGVALRHLGRHSESILVLLKAIDNSPASADLRVSLANTYAELGCHWLAIEAYCQAVVHDPAHVHAHFNLGNSWQAIGHFDRAASAYRQALALAPQRADIANNLGMAVAALGDLDGASDALHTAIRLAPQFADAHFNLSMVLEDCDDHAASLASLDRAIEFASDKLLWTLRRQRTWPLVFADEMEADHHRSELLAACRHWPEQLKNYSLMDIAGVGLHPPFNTAHQPADERILREAFANCFPRPSPSRWNRRTGRRPRVGWVVTAGHEPLFLRCCAGILRGLCGGSIEHILFVHAAARHQAHEALADCELQFRPLGTDLRTATTQISDAQCDLLYHWEIGTDSLNYFLPMMRLAPLQCTSWGTVTTSGMPDVDYYVSSRLVEPPGAARHYTETLVELDSLLSFQPPAAVPMGQVTAESFGLAGNRLYVCVQNLLKIHPATDRLFAEILRNDARGLLVLKHRRHPHVGRLLEQRFRRTIGDVADRIVFLPWQTREDYFKLIKVADCLLDTPYYGAGSSCYDIFSLHRPMVTLPGELNIGRYAVGCYRRMGLDEPIAANTAEYVAKAVRIANDQDYRHYLERRIAESSETIFNESAVVSQFAEFLEQTIISDIPY